MGAPLAVGILEELIALGCRKFIACGGAGVLNQAIALGNLVIPASAVRDEGTSYHYLPPSREVSATPAAVAAIRSRLAARDGPAPECGLDEALAALENLAAALGRDQAA